MKGGTYMNKRTQTSGFTIIEVVLVLAIAALIFLMIFVALPALQRGQRDTARKNDVGTIASAVSTYRSNNRNQLPAATADLDSYLDELAQISTVTVTDTGGTEAINEDAAKIYTGMECNGTDAQDGGPRDAAVRAFIENGDVYCQDV